MPEDGARALRRRAIRLARGIYRTAIHPILSVVLPARCFGCDRELRAEQYLGACCDCWTGLLPLVPPVCASCGVALPLETDLVGPARGRCAACVLAPLGLDGVRAAVRYDSLSRRFLLRAKSGGRKEILSVLGRQLGSMLSVSGFAGGCTIVAPVPSHPWVLFRRGYNPALEIARPAAKTVALPLVRLLSRRLARRRASKRLRAPGRRLSVVDAFRVRAGLKGHRVLLIDDVLTTGATLAACADALRRAGAVEVRAAVWARTPLRDPPSPFQVETRRR